jgi:hypothetical protein
MPAKRASIVQVMMVVALDRPPGILGGLPDPRRLDGVIEVEIERTRMGRPAGSGKHCDRACRFALTLPPEYLCR